MVDDKSGAPEREAVALVGVFEQLDERTGNLERRTQSYARAIVQAFTGAVASGKQFDDVLKSLVLRMSNMAVNAAMRPISRGIAGGVVGTPSYFPMASGGFGLAGESGPEAILPLARGADGKLGVSAGGGAQPVRISIHIASPDVESFRRSEAYVTGQIARAVARGQRSL
jgi:phage-related minor tail protein